jgi:hypothetical protein
LTAFAGRDMTGRFIDADLYGKFAGMLQSGLGRVVDEARPILVQGSARWLERKAWARVSVLLAPLCAEDGVVNIILGGMAVERTGGAGSGTPPTGTVTALS